MKYFTTLVKTHYSRGFLEEQQNNILTELKKIQEIKEAEAKILNITTIETHLEIAIWPLNGQMINQDVKNEISGRIRLILDEQFILSIDTTY